MSSEKSPSDEISSSKDKQDNKCLNSNPTNDTSNNLHHLGQGNIFISALQDNVDLEQQVLTKIQGTDESRPKVFKNSAHEIFCILTFTFAVACTSISVGAFQISLNEISKEFNISGGRLTWSVTSINVANGATLLLSGNISDVVGRKNCVVFGFIAFAISGLIGGFMKSFIGVVIWRSLMGLSLAFCVPASGGLLSSLYPVSVRKNRVMACFAAGAPIGFCAGIICGGICTEFLSWRAIHYFLAIFYGLISVGSIFIVPSDLKIESIHHLKTDILPNLLKIDYMGGFLITSGLVLVLFALNQASVPASGWNTDYIIATIVVGGCLLVIFVIYESYVPKRPLMPMFIWKNKDFSLAMIVVFFAWMCFQGVLTYFSILYFEQILNYSPLHTMVCVLPMAVFGATVCAIAAFILHIVSGKIILTFACLSFFSSSLIWATMKQHTNYFRAPFEAYCFAVLGADLTFNVVNMITVNSVNNELQSTAQGVFQTIVQFSTAVGLSLSNTIVTELYPPFANTQDIDLNNKQNLKDLFHSFRYAYYFAIGVSAFATLVSLFIKVGTSGTQEAAQKKLQYDLKNEENYTKEHI